MNCKTYVYESVSYWDEEKKQSRSRRRVIGKVDPETGETVPTGKRGGRPRKNPEQPGQHAGQDPSAAEGARKEAEIRSLRLLLDQKEEEIRSLRRENGRQAAMIEKVRRQLSSCLEAMGTSQM